jgi:hypothetical protein
MEPIVTFVIHVIIALLIATVLYWMTGLAAKLAPAPMQERTRAVLLLLLGCLFLLFLSGELGAWGTWGIWSGGGHGHLKL